MKKVLIITYYWPPSGGSGVQRWLKFAKYLPQYGWEPVIYTPENPEANAVDEALLKDVLPGTEVIKTRIWEPYQFYRRLIGKSDKKVIKANLIGSSDTSFRHRISLFIRGNLFIPDPRIFWIRPSVKFLKKYLKKHPVDAIISTGPPHSMHLIAQQVARATGIKWIADFRDPWTEIFYFKHLKLSRYAYKKHRRLEQGVMDNADRIIVVSRQMQEDFKKRTATPVEIITNGFDPDDFINKRQTPAAGGKTVADLPGKQLPADPLSPEAGTGRRRFRLVHTGIFADNGNPGYLWESLREKAQADPAFRNDLEIRLMGQADDSVLKAIEKAGLTENLVNMGYVPHTVVTRWQQAASVLLLPLRKEPESAAILTGKFFEYLASGSPILAFGPVNGDLAGSLQETGSGTIVDFEDKAGTLQEINRLYNIFKETRTEGEHGIIPERKPDPKALKYSRKNLAGELASLLDNVK